MRSICSNSFARAARQFASGGAGQPLGKRKKILDRRRKNEKMFFFEKKNQKTFPDKNAGRLAE
jgi:hypothetical protein